MHMGEEREWERRGGKGGKQREGGGRVKSQGGGGEGEEEEEEDQTEKGQIGECCLGVIISYSCTTVPTCTDVL